MRPEGALSALIDLRVDSALRIERVGAPLRRLLELAEEGVVGRGLVETLVHPCAREGLAERLARGEAEEGIELPLLHASGAERPAVLRLVRVDEAFVGSVTDLSAFERVEARLRETTRALEESQRVSGIGSYRLDFRTGRWTSSQTLDRLFGIDASYERSVEGWAALVHPEDRASMLRYLAEEVTAKLLPFDREYRIVRHGTGETRWMLGRGAVRTGPSGEPVEMIGTILDVTERREAAEALAASEARFRRIAEGASDLVWRTDAAGRVLYVNAAVEPMLGRAPAEVLGLGHDAYLTPSSVARIRESVRAALRASPVTQQLEWELTYVRPDGVLVDGEVHAHLVLGGDGRIQAVEGITRDVTHRREEAERERQRQAQAVQRDRLESIGTLAGGVAHDFNNLLAVIQSFVGFALDDLSADHPVRGDLLEAQAAARRAAELTRQLLAFSRRQILEPRVLVPSSIASGLERMLRRLIGEHLRLELSLAPDTGRVRADPGQLEQVLMNLVVNARDAMPEGGRITISTRNVTVGADEARPELGEGRWVELAVRDEGCGMDEATRRRVFEPFFTTKELGKGTGLGLATVYGIVRQSGGQVLVESEPGRGATFRVLLPRVSEEAEGSLGSTVSARPGGTESILLVEDEAAVRRATARMLRGAGYRVEEAGDGEEALSIARREGARFELLVTDVVMPRLGGRELAERLGAERPGLRVLFLTGYTVDAAGMGERGASVLPKPFGVEELLRKVREVLAG